MCIKDMINDSKNMTLDRSIDMRLALSRNDGSSTDVKCYSFHKSASTPLWRIALWILGIIAGMIIVCKIVKCKKQHKCECGTDCSDH